MPEMTDPMEGLVALQRALDEGFITMQGCCRHKELSFVQDEPLPGEPRLTYAVIDRGKVQCSVTIAPNGRFNDLPCLQIGYSVVESARGRGLATRVVEHAIDELQFQLARNGVTRFYIEAVVAADNVPSNRLAARLLTTDPERTTDSRSGTMTNTYLRLFSTAGD